MDGKHQKRNIWRETTWRDAGKQDEGIWLWGTREKRWWEKRWKETSNSWRETRWREDGGTRRWETRWREKRWREPRRRGDGRQNDGEPGAWPEFGVLAVVPLLPEVLNPRDICCWGCRGAGTRYGRQNFDGQKNQRQDEGMMGDKAKGWWETRPKETRCWETTRWRNDGGQDAKC